MKMLFLRLTRSVATWKEYDQRFSFSRSTGDFSMCRRSEFATAKRPAWPYKNASFKRFYLKEYLSWSRAERGSCKLHITVLLDYYMLDDTPTWERGDNMCLTPVKMVKMTYIQDLTGERVTRMIYDFNLDKMYEKFPYAEFEAVDVACGKCLECLAQKSREWSFRMMCEAKLHKDNCFITLTYADNPVNLVPRDLTLFLKRLRKKLQPFKIRYFACGEYGSKGKRPHYHLIIFGWKPDDLQYFFTSDGNPIYKSHKLEKLWNLGFVTVGDLTLKSCKYCAKYLQKFNKLLDKEVQPFTRMSLKPGIGLEYFKSNSFAFLNTDKLYIDGEWCKIPRYFLEFSRRAYFFNCDDLKKMRQFKGKFLKINKNKLNFQAKHLTYF